MGRPILITWLLCLAGCSPHGANNPAVSSSDAASAFHFDKAKQVIFLDTRAAPPQRQRFWLPLGSITLETLHRTKNRLTFRYTPETEGGYTIYECTVPVSSTPLEFHVKSDGTPGATSFDVTKCKVVQQGDELSE